MLRWLVLIATTALAAACSDVRNAKPDTAAREARAIEQLLSNQQYSEAIAQLEQDPRLGTSAEKQQQLRRVRDLAANYDKVMNAAIHEAVRKEDWSTAYRLLHEGMKNYPDGYNVREWYDDLDPKRVQRLAELRTNLLLERAQWVMQARPLLREIAFTDPGNRVAVAELEHINAEAQRIATQLSNVGVAALGEKKLELAERCLNMSDRLHPIAENILALERLDQQRHEMNLEKRKQRLREEEDRQRVETEKRRQQARAEVERQQQESRRLTEEIYAAIGSWDLLRAQALLEKLHEVDNVDPQLRGVEYAVETAVMVRVDEWVEKGNTLYSNGDVDAAKAVWEQALALNPGNIRVRDRIQRAERVLQNLRDQQKRPATGH
jgi:tetratricopeptide (TPR) repeat protein